MQAVDSVEYDLKHCGYLRKEATEQYLPTLIRAAKAQFAEARGSAERLEDAIENAKQKAVDELNTSTGMKATCVNGT